MNTTATFRLCTLTDEELIEKVDQKTDQMFKSREVPLMHIPARPNEDYDLLVGELILRMRELTKTERRMSDKTIIESALLMLENSSFEDVLKWALSQQSKQIKDLEEVERLATVLVNVAESSGDAFKKLRKLLKEEQ